MQVVVVGPSGVLGRLVGAELERRGHAVRGVSRSTGVDLVGGGGAREALRGADAVVDCSNVQTASAGRAIAGFGAIARHLAEAVLAEHVPHLVAVSIVGVPSPELQAKAGYYRGKAEQERVLAASGAPVTLVRSTQWFELAATFLRGRIGPLAIVPRMRSQPIAAASVASAITDVVEAGPGGGDRVLAGPEERDVADLARAIAEADGAPRFVLPIRIPGADRLFRAGALLPAPDVPRTGPTFEEWLAARS